MADNLITVLIADDHPVVRSGLKALLTPRNGIQVVAEATDGAEAVMLAHTHRPDVVLMDMRMPKIDGAAATKQIVSQCDTSRVLILSSYDDERALAQAILAGASGCLLKESPPDALYDAIRSVHEGKVTMPQPLALRLMNAVKSLDNAAEALTPREQDVLTGLAQGLSNQEIGSILGISKNTVRTHVSNLLQKLGYANRTQLALYARENVSGGFTQPSDPPAGTATIKDIHK